MAIQPPNDGLLTENAQQYFQGSQGFRGDNANSAGQSFTTSFDTDLYLGDWNTCLLYTSPSPRDGLLSRMPSSA